MNIKRMNIKRIKVNARLFNTKYTRRTTHTHTHTYIYIYIYLRTQKFRSILEYYF